MAATAPETQCDLPKMVVKRIVKEKIASMPGGKADLQINKEALLAFGESAKVFVSFITATANDVCKEKKRATVSADDVFQALEDVEFGDLVPALQEAFEAYKQSNKEKKEKKAEVSRKRKSETAEAAPGDEDEGAAAAAEEPADTTAASDKSGGDAAVAAAAAAAPPPQQQQQQPHTEEVQASAGTEGNELLHAAAEGVTAGEDTAMEDAADVADGDPAGN